VDIWEFIEGLAAKGRYHFTTEEAAQAVGSSYVAARAAIRRLRLKGRVAMPYRGFNVFVPPEYRRLGCLPAEQFVPQLLEQLGLEYYVGLLSAAEIHGAAHQRPQVFQVVVAANRPPMRCGAVRAQFVARRNASEIPAFKQNTPRGHIKIASAEATAFDLVGYVHHCGGLSNVATVLSELAEKMKAEETVRVAPLSPIPWAQRLGYLLEVAGGSAVVEPLAEHVRRVAREYAPLNPRRGERGRGRSSRWKLVINEEVEADL
jgi:predicted transcriptional regulator of viral defense system